MEAASWALVFLTFVLALATGYYAYEAHKQRQAAENNLVEMGEARRVSERALEVAQNTLSQIQTEHNESHRPYVIATQPDWAHNIHLLNLGPGAATKIFIWTVAQIDGRWQYYQGSLAGLPVAVASRCQPISLSQRMRDWRRRRRTRGARSGGGRCMSATYR